MDDSRLDAERARSILQDSYDIKVFHDGAAALEALAEGPAPDVIVLDWIMPDVGGLEVTRYLRTERPGQRSVAILILTATRAADQIAEGMGAGANDYLHKPYDEVELLARVGSLITAKQLLERVDEAEDTVRRLLVQSPDALIFVDAHGRITYANPEAERVIGLPVVALAGRPLAEVVPGLPLSQLAGRSQPVLSLPDLELRGEVYAPTVRFLPSDFAASTSIALRNVTERRRVESRRLDFYSIIAHDLRSPLSAVLLRTDFILRGGRGILPAELIADMRKIDLNIRSMVSLINDFLDLARLEGGGYELDSEVIDLGQLVASTVDDIRPLADESRLSLDVVVEQTGLRVHGDRRRLIQVITNLLSNAIKFTPPGGAITVTVERRDVEIEIRVRDTGRGISPAMLPHLFQRYSRGPERAEPTGGTGLGLMIVREIAEAHGGSASVQSELEAGSTFTVRLPSAVGAHAGELTDVLVVDDDGDIRDSLQFVLEKAGYTVDTAQNGQEALGKLTSGLTPRLVVLDVSMPVMTGPELLAAMQTDLHLARLPVCVMSGNLAALGAAPPGALVLQKPIQVDRLLDFLGRLAPSVLRLGAL